jgi:DNA polymerase-3 subunit delta
VPTLDLARLEQCIARRALAPVHLLYGDDARLLERVVRDIEATIDPADRPFAVERIYAGDANGAAVDIAAAARVYPMLGDRRIVIVLRAERLLKPKRASKAVEPDGEEGDEAAESSIGDVAALEDYLEDPPASTSLVFVAADVDRTRRLTKRLLQAAQVTAFPGLGSEGPGGRREARIAAVGWLREEFARLGRAIEPAAIELLADRAAGDISKLRGDVERLAIFTEGQPRIRREDVEEVAAVGTDVDDWAVVNAIADGDAPGALRAVAARFDRGDSPHALVGQLRWWVSQRLAESAPERAVAALDALLRADLALKSSAGSEQTLVERLVIDLTGRPVRTGGTWGGGAGPRSG